jgi:predicted small lipoprotein YifL
MKRLVAMLVLASALVGSLAACGTPNPDGSTTVVPQTDKIR